jgi:hypothetical protein
MASSGSVFSETLNSITTTKLDELSKKRARFEEQLSTVRGALQTEQNPLQRLFVAVEGAKVCLGVKTAPQMVKDVYGNDRLGRSLGGTGNPKLETDLNNVDRFLEQARFDPSISTGLLSELETTVLRHLTVQSLKYRYATLYGQVVTEWLSSETAAAQTSTENVDMAEAFEDIPGAQKLESRAEWEKSVFEPFEADVPALKAYLTDLFGAESTENNEIPKAFHALQESVERFEDAMAAPQPFNQDSLRWTVNGLLSSDLLTDEKRAVLKDFLGHQVVLTEIADVLNMRMAALQDWSWGDHVLVEQRKRINGTYSIHLHEDLLQAIFLQFIGVKLCVFFKKALKQFFKATMFKKLSTVVPAVDRKRRQYYLGRRSNKRSVVSRRRMYYQRYYFLYQLPAFETQQTHTAEGEEEADAAPRPSGRTKQTARRSTGGKAPRKQLVSTDDFVDYSDVEEDDDYDDDGYTDSDDDYDDHVPLDTVKNPMEAKQTILHLLSTEIAINTRLHGEITCFRSAFDQWNPSLPHSTILTILEFFGISTKWLAFFRKFLEAPLKFADEPSVGTRTRRRGMPGSHSLSDAFGELALFCLDFSVARATDGAFLHRIYDSFWFWSPDHAKCVKAWNTVTAFAGIMGVSLSETASGTVRISRNSGSSHQLVRCHPSLPLGDIRWGFLYLDSASGRFQIDQTLIDTHIKDLRRQLQSKGGSVFSWIRAWNVYATTYFTTNFGKPANCFGREHVDNILGTYERIHRVLFSSNSKSVVEYVKALLEERFGASDIPDGFIFFPIELGGLELKNPFVGPLLIRDSVLENPAELLDSFEEAENAAYAKAKQRFETSGRAFRKDRRWAPDTDKETFMSFEEYTRYREDMSYGYQDELVNVFDKLMRRPAEVDITASVDVLDGINNGLQGKNTRGIIYPWACMDPYWKSVTQLYGPDLMDRFGSLNIVDAGLLPIGMVSLFKGKRTQWSD